VPHKRTFHLRISLRQANPTLRYHSSFIRDQMWRHELRDSRANIDRVLHMTIRGGCLCGNVEYEVELPFIKFVKCHCSRCRKATGSAFAANAYVLPQAFRWTAGEDQVVRFDFPKARSFSTSFCRECGSPLPHATRSGREVIVPAGSLHNDPGSSPTIDTCWQSRAPWLSDAINLPTSD
jgi:hypothetical protein